MLSLLTSFGLGFGFENDVSQQLVLGIFTEFVSEYVGIVSGIVTPVASESSRSAMIRDSSTGMR